MNREIKLSSKTFAETLFASLKADVPSASLSEKDGKFILAYEIKADGPEGADDVDEKIYKAYDKICCMMDSRLSYVYSQIDSLYNALATHYSGHLPPLTASGLSKLIKVAGEEDNYQVQPRQIYASDCSVEFGAQELKMALTKLNESDSKQPDSDVNRLMSAIRLQKK